MKIFLAFLQAKKQHAVPSYGFWEGYIKNGLAEGGHEWLEADIDWAAGLVHEPLDELRAWRTDAWSKAVDYIKNQNPRPDFFLGYFFPWQVDTSAVAEIRRLGVPCINFFCDNVRQFKKIPQEYSCFDLNWVPEFAAQKMYTAAGIPFIHKPMPIWVPPEYRHPNHEETYGVSFIGSSDIQRQRLMRDVLMLNSDIKIYGKGWVNTGTRRILRTNLPRRLWLQLEFVTTHGVTPWLRKILGRYRKKRCDLVAPAAKGMVNADDYIKITQESMICLGINRYPGYLHSFARPHTYSRLRDLEAPMLGACYLTEYADGLGDLYEIGREIEVYYTAQDLAEKIDWLKSNPEKRKEMRRLAQARALNYHTVARSIADIGTALGLK